MLKTKHRKPFSRLLAVMMSLAMVLALIPATAMAEETSQGGMVLSKTATLEDDGTYTIELSAYATGTTTTVTEKSGVPLDIVLVLDQSGSMYTSEYLTPLKNAVTAFVNTISSNAKDYNVDHRIALVGYASNRNDGKSNSGTISSGSSNSYWINTGLFVDGYLENYAGNSNTSSLTSQDYKDALVNVNTNGNVTSSITTAISNIAASGATRTNYGMEMANGVFENNPIEENSDRKRIVVVFTDGEPGKSGYNETIASAALAEAYKTKNTYNATVYTVGLYSSAGTNVTTFMNYLSSNYPTAQSMSGTVYSYEPVYAISTSNTYYVESENGYTLVRYYYSKWYDSEWSSYTPKTTANGAGTQFYSRTETTEKPEQSADKYYMTTSNPDELNNIFTNISKDIQNPSTSVKLDKDSVMRDVLADGFKLPEGFDPEKNITIQTLGGSTKDGSKIEWDENAEDVSATVTASVSEQKNIINITGFNYSDEYIAPSHSGKKLLVTIKGVEATDGAITNEQVDTNTAASGIYATSDAENCIPFPQPKTILTSKTYVLDYAKPVTVSSSDWKQSKLNKISGDMSKNAAAVSAKYGTVTKNDDNTVTYSPKTTNWDGYDSFYAFGTTTDETIKAASANANGNLWSKISVIPANNVYYEDDFVTDNSTGTVGIVYDSSNWKTVYSSDKTTSGGNTEDVNGAVQGWITDLANDAEYSDGSAHVASTQGATAEFTFTGTGVDIYSRTDMEVGKVRGQLYKVGDTENILSKAIFVDNLSASGTYYQIPTLTFDNLDYGTYTVKLTVGSMSTENGGKRSNYYLDGIRVYNPIQNKETDKTVQDAYSAAGELNAVFTEVRDILIDTENKDFSENGAVFIDKNADGSTGTTTSEVGTYVDYGPKNEVYLSEGQAITFSVSDIAANYYVGIKAPNGETSASITNGDNTSSLNIGAASDLYYKVVPVASGDNAGTIMIKNTGKNLLSVTKLRSTGGGTVAAANIPMLLSYADEFDSLEVVEYTYGRSTENEEETATETEESVETEESTEETGEVIIQNPEEPEDETEETNTVGKWISDLLKGFKNLFGRS